MDVDQNIIEHCSMKTSWHSIQLFHNGDDFFTELISSVRQAQKSITAEFYIFEIDVITEILLTELQLAVLRGCEVQLLVDGVGSLLWVDALSRRCHQEGIHFRVYHPIPGFLQGVVRLPVALFSKASPFFRRANRRNHRKTVVIDQKIALLGSMNMTRVHFQKVMKEEAWRDTCVKVEGPAIESLVAAFELAWVFARKRALFPNHAAYVRKQIQKISRWELSLRLNANNKIRRHLYKDLCRRIAQSRRQVSIATAYFLPKRAIVRALAKAARRGVDVKVLIPGPTDVPLVKWAAYQLPLKLQQQGVKIYEYQHRVFHAKYMIIDDWSSVGSLNLNHRSLLHDLEVEAVLTDEVSLKNLRAQYERDLQDSKLLDIEKFAQNSFLKNWISWLLFKLRYWF